LCALHRHTGQSVWLEAAARAARWIAGSVDESGAITSGCAPADSGAAYLTQVAWSLLEAASLTGEAPVRDAAVRILEAVRKRRTLFGAFSGWGFAASDAAFTHTIAYTLRGFLESARLLGDWTRYGKPVVIALRRLADEALALRGRLPGAYDTEWHSDRRYTCLSGNAQVALCLLAAYPATSRSRFLEAARILVEEICRHQRPAHPVAALRGAVPGSSPLWGRYMRGAYPSWSVKYLCDAIVALSECGPAWAYGKVDPMRTASSRVAFTTM
jgi:uncharacterized protein YyaL (SSP411 family)